MENTYKKTPNKAAIVVIIASLFVIVPAFFICFTALSIAPGQSAYDMVADNNTDTKIVLTQEYLREDLSEYIDTQVKGEFIASIVILSIGAVAVIFAATALIMRIRGKSNAISGLYVIIPSFIIAVPILGFGAIFAFSSIPTINSWGKPCSLDTVKCINKEVQENEHRDDDGTVSVTYSYLVTFEEFRFPMHFDEDEYNNFNINEEYYRAKSSSGQVFKYYSVEKFTEE